MTISTSVPIFIIFLFSLHRVATEPHLPRKKNLTGIRSNIAASSDAGAKPGKSGGGAEREEQNGRNRAYIEKTYRFRSSKLNRKFRWKGTNIGFWFKTNAHERSDIWNKSNVRAASDHSPAFSPDMRQLDSNPLPATVQAQRLNWVSHSDACLIGYRGDG